MKMHKAIVWATMILIISNILFSGIILWKAWSKVYGAISLRYFYAVAFVASPFIILAVVRLIPIFTWPGAILLLVCSLFLFILNGFLQLQALSEISSTKDALVAFSVYCTWLMWFLVLVIIAAYFLVFFLSKIIRKKSTV